MSNLIIDTPSRHIYYGDGSTRVFPVPTFIEGDDWIRIEIDGVHVINRREWDIVNNSIIFVVAPPAGSSIDVLVASSIEAMTQFGSTSSIDVVAESITNVNLVGQNIESVVNVSNNLNIITEDFEEVIIVGSNIVDVNTVANNIEDVNIVSVINDKVTIAADNIEDINTVAQNIGDVNIVANKAPELIQLTDTLNQVGDILPYSAQIQLVGNDLANNYEFIDDYGLITDEVSNVAQEISNIETVATNIDDIINTTTIKDEIIVVSTNISDINTVAGIDTKVTTVADNILDIQNAEKNAWKAEAEKLTAISYATEPEDVYVKIYTSNNDGTFTITDTADYSALHWERKAASLSISGIIDDAVPALNRTYSSSKVDSELQTIDGSIQTINTDLGLIDNRVQTVETDAGLIDNRVQTVETDVGLMDGRVQTVETDVGLIDNRVQTVETDVGLIDGRLQTVETAVSDILDDIANLDGVVKTTGNQTIDGIKTFSSNPIVPTPTSGTHAVNKSYVDNNTFNPTPTIVTGTATFDGSQNKIQLTGIGAGVEIGDVIKISGASNAKNNSAFTVEVIVNSNTIIVNQAHTNLGTIKNLVSNIDAGVTVKLLAKWYNAPLGLGQGWCNMTSSRNKQVNYTNTTGKTIAVYIQFPSGSSGEAVAILVDGVAVGSVTTGSMANFFLVPPGSVYSTTTARGISVWSELR